jgi:hypothetical protein
VVVLVCGDAELASWELRRRPRLDLSVVDDLARLQLAAGRLGCAVRLRAPCAELVELLDLLGLAEVLPELGEVRRKAEDREQRGVEEAVVADDPVA